VVGITEGTVRNRNAINGRIKRAVNLLYEPSTKQTWYVQDITPLGMKPVLLGGGTFSDGSTCVNKDTQSKAEFKFTAPASTSATMELRALCGKSTKMFVAKPIKLKAAVVG
jgi:hypothetical protein